MYRRSSSGTHFQREIIAAVDSSHGVRLDGGSTGGIVEAFAEDTSASLTVRAKGAGILTLGQSTSPVSIPGSSFTLGTSSSPGRITVSTLAITSSQITLGSTASSIVIGNSTTYFTAVQRYLVQSTIPELTASNAADATYSVTGLSTGSAVVVNMLGAALSTLYVMGGVRCSTTDELTIRWLNNSASTIGSANTTMSFRVLEFKY